MQNTNTEQNYLMITGNESATYGGEIDVVVDKTAPGVPTVAVSKGLIAEATSDVTLTVTLPSGTEAGEKVELYTFASGTYTPVSGHVAGAAKVVSDPEASAGQLAITFGRRKDT